MMALRFVCALIALFVAPCVDAFWRMECRARSGLGRLDPLMSPGEVSQHVHYIHGSSGFNPSATYDELMGGDCTSCSVIEDKSAYWTPSLYFQTSDGEFTMVDQVGGMLAYYFLNPAPGVTGNITAFPAGFRMIAGDSRQRNFTLPVPDPPQSEWSSLAGQTTQAGLAAKALGFNCLNYATIPEGSLYRHFMPDKSYIDANCADGIRLELMFPSCWDGVNLDSDDHKSHVAYPDLVIQGTCPEGYPVRLPGLFYETIVNTPAFTSQSGQFVFANGDPTGYGYHGDFLMGWTESTLQNAVDTCLNASGKIQDCPVFTIQDSAAYSSCNLSMTDFTSSVAEVYETEDVLGPDTALPGNVAIQSGPAYAQLGGAAATATGAATTDHTGAAVPTLSYAPGASASDPASVSLGAIFVATKSDSVKANAAVATTTQAAAATITAAPAATTTADVDRPVTTVFSTSGHEVIQLEVYEKTITDYETTTTTVFNRRRHAHLRRHGGH